MMPWQYDDGGRAAAGFRGTAGDCVTRAIAIATQLPYRQVYDDLNALAVAHERTRRSRSRTGVRRPVFDRYLRQLGWHWLPTMGIGTGCQVHLRPQQLPAGRIVVVLSKHVAAVVDCRLHDTHDCSRDGYRCVYGVWTPYRLEPWW